MVRIGFTRKERFDKFAYPQEGHVPVHCRSIAKLLLDDEHCFVGRDCLGNTAVEVFRIEDMRRLRTRDQQVCDADIFGLGIQQAIRHGHIGAVVNVVGVHVHVGRLPSHRRHVDPAAQHEIQMHDLPRRETKRLRCRPVFKAFHRLDRTVAGRHFDLKTIRNMEEGFFVPGDFSR